MECNYILTIKCEDSYCHLMKKVVLSMKILMSIYNIQHGFLRCGDDIIFNESKLIDFLINTEKTDYMGYHNINANPNRNVVFKKIDNFIPEYFVTHPEDLLNPLNGLTSYSIEKIVKLNESPTCLTNVGVIIYFSLKSCNCLIQEMNKVNWNIFHYDEKYGYKYFTEDVGIACALLNNNILPTYYEFWGNDINKFIGIHTNVSH